MKEDYEEWIFDIIKRAEEDTFKTRIIEYFLSNNNEWGTSVEIAEKISIPVSRVKGEMKILEFCGFVKGLKSIPKENTKKAGNYAYKYKLSKEFMKATQDSEEKQND